MKGIAMEKKKIVVDFIDVPPKAKIDEEMHSLLCEYTSKDGKGISIYGKEDSCDTVVIINRDLAVIDLFSTAENKMKELADFIEATVTKKYGVDISEDEFRKTLLSVCDRKDYPFLHHAINESTKTSFLQNLTLNFLENSKKRILSLDLLKQMKVHIVSVETAEKAAEMENGIYSPEVTYEKSEPKISTAALLPEGWSWSDYNDGSGSLYSPNRNAYFIYDLAPYVHENGIEYQKDKESQWDVFKGSLAEFKKYAETSINMKLSFMLGDISIPEIQGQVEHNAWYGKEPTTVYIMAGENEIKIQGYTYEPGYEYFSATSSISFNGQELYGKDSRCVEAYRYETYDTGIYKDLVEAVSYIKEQTKGLDYIITAEEKRPLTEKIQEAQGVVTTQENVTVKEKKTERGI